MTFMIGRRRFLAGAGVALAVAPFAAAHAEIAHLGARSLSFHNIHTGEKLAVEYWADGEYVPDALQTVNHLLRDYRNGEVHVIEPKLLDLLTILRARLDSQAPFEVISGYRSPATNAMLHAESSGVAAKSLHMQGMAIDIRVGEPLAPGAAQLRAVAARRRRGLLSDVGFRACGRGPRAHVGRRLSETDVTAAPLRGRRPLQCRAAIYVPGRRPSEGATSPKSRSPACELEARSSEVLTVAA